MIINLNLKNKNIYLSPYTDLTVELLNKLNLEYLNFNGFIDKIKTGENIFKKKNLVASDYVLVCSPNHLHSILDDLKDYNTIPIYYLDNQFYPYSIPYFKIIKEKVIRLKENFLNKRYKIKKLKNKHLNQRAFIIANGPSLNIADIEILKDEITFAANKIWLFFDQTSWRPTYYSVTDKLVMSQNLNSIESVESKAKLFPDFLLKHCEKRVTNSIYFKFNHNSNFNLENGIYTGPTVIYALISYAIYMGIKELYIIGLDHDFKIPQRYKDYKKGDSNVIVSEGEINHFHKDYRKKGEKWAQPELGEITQSFKLLNKLAKEYHVNIYNASRKSKLEVFEKVDLDKIIKG